MRCLWLARVIPLPLSSGENIYTARLAQALVAAGASVTFMGLATSAASSLPAAEAFESRIEWSIVPGRPIPTVLALASPLPIATARFGTRDYAQHLEAMLRERDFDGVILDHYPMAWAIGHIQGSKRNGARPLIAYIAHNFETKVAADIARNFRGNLLRKAALYANARKTANAARSLASAADIIVTLTAEDAKSSCAAFTVKRQARASARLQRTARAGPANRAGHAATCRHCRRLPLDGQANEFVRLSRSGRSHPAKRWRRP